MANKVLEYVVRARDLTKKGLDSAGNGFQRLRAKVNRGVAGALKRIFSLRAGMVALTAAAGFLTLAIKTAFEFERYETQFKVLFGSTEKAKEHIQELQRIAAGTPFQFGDIAKASRQLNILTGGVMGARESLLLVGDAAATTGADISELSMWVGRAYGAIKSGRPFGEAAMRLMELGVLTPDVRAEMEKLQKAGASNAEVWGLLENEIGRFEGGMKEMSKTGEGMFSTLKDNWTLTLAEFGDEFKDLAKNDIGKLTDKLKELRENGDIAVWAHRTKEILDDLAKTAGAVATAIEFIYKHSGAKKAVSKLKAGSAVAGTLAGGGSIKDAVINGLGEYDKSQNGDPAKKAKEDEIRANAKKKDENEVKSKVTNEKSLKEKMQNDLAKAQEVIDKKRAHDAVEKGNKEFEKESIRRQKEEEKLTKKRIAEQKKLNAEKKRLKQKGIRGELQENQIKLGILGKNRGSAEKRLNAAQNQVDRAWGWIRDPKSFKAQLQEEKAQRKAEKRFEKDEAKLKDKKDWRTRKLNARDEAVRRMIIAKEEKKAAEDHLKNILKQVEHLGVIRRDLQRNLAAAGG